jgi:hypothetical protein
MFPQIQDLHRRDGRRRPGGRRCLGARRYRRRRRHPVLSAPPSRANTNASCKWVGVCNFFLLLSKILAKFKNCLKIDVFIYGNKLPKV